ncbi:hypothetical protein D9C73_027412 [Collichthys lucidus]|uniref:Chemokine interleukin-8-like domain-containing protein n=1 Tax=Collichthys lucidus TaxID=240159 RepID=A0A4V6XZ48_COLLU|nr:hypothetical protein D9C73_027412 [Collichthys lucidus]
MRTSHILLLCILGAALLPSVICSSAIGPDDCCFKFYPRRVMKNLIKSYYLSDHRCSKAAVIQILSQVRDASVVLNIVFLCRTRSFECGPRKLTTKTSTQPNDIHTSQLPDIDLTSPSPGSTPQQIYGHSTPCFLQNVDPETFIKKQASANMGTPEPHYTPLLLLDRTGPTVTPTELSPWLGETIFGLLINAHNPLQKGK